MRRGQELRNLTRGPKGKRALLIALAAMTGTALLALAVVKVAPEWLILIAAFTTFWRQFTDWVIVILDWWSR